MPILIYFGWSVSLCPSSLETDAIDTSCQNGCNEMTRFHPESHGCHGYPGSLSRKKLGHHWGQPPTSPTHSAPSSAASVTMATRPSEAASLKVSRTCSACVSRTSHETWMQQGTGNPSFSQLNPVARGLTLGCVSAPKK